MLKNILIRNMQDPSGKIYITFLKRHWQWNKHSLNFSTRGSFIISPLTSVPLLKLAACRWGSHLLTWQRWSSAQIIWGWGYLLLPRGSAVRLVGLVLLTGSFFKYITTFPYEVSPPARSAPHPPFFFSPGRSNLTKFSFSDFLPSNNCMPILGKGDISEAVFRDKMILHSAPYHPSALQLLRSVRSGGWTRTEDS